MKIPDGEHLAQITKRLRTSSAVVPALIFDAIVLPISLTGLVVGDPALRPIFVGALLTGIILTALQIVFFTIFDRDRLHNEDHIERKMLLSRMRPEVGDSRTVISISPDQVVIGNPALKGERDA